MILIIVLTFLLSVVLIKASTIYEYSPKALNENLFQSYVDNLNLNSKTNDTKSIIISLDINQFSKMAKEIGFQKNDENIQALFNKMDINKDQKVDKNEFVDVRAADDYINSVAIGTLQMILSMVFTVQLFVTGIFVSLFYGLIYLLNKLGEFDL